MNRHRSLELFVCFSLLVSSATLVEVYAYEVETHQKISEAAALDSEVDGRLRESLAIPHGLAEEIQGKSLEKWIEEGSLRADDWTYFFNHLHNPLAEWSAAGYGAFYSAILWGQTPNQGVPSWGWPNTRQYFLDALTSATKTDRDEGLKNTFQGLGHAMHLIQDMASPAHTRNDPHLASSFNYESLVKQVQKDENGAFLAWLNGPYVGPDPGWQTLLPNPQAPVPIARLIDTDRYDGNNPAITIEPRMGLAEYTNANFVSEDRIFRENSLLWRFPYPRQSSVTIQDYAITLKGQTDSVLREYYRKDFDGETGYRLATVGFLRDYIQTYQLDPSRYGDSPALDEGVYRDFANLLVPRAVSYSTALLDYFFRGKLEATIEVDPGDAQGLQLTGKNASPESLANGTLEVYGTYAGGERRRLASWANLGAVAPGAELSGQPLKFTPQPPIPSHYMVVYTGDLGEEKKDNPPGFGGAVIGKAAKYGGVLEELILFRTSADTYDVYFRNQFQIALLGLSEHLPVLPDYFDAAEVHWGVDSNHFFVKNYEMRTVANTRYAVPIYKIFKINRPDNAVSGDEPVTVELRRTIRPPETPLPYNWKSGLSNGWSSEMHMVYPFGGVPSTPPLTVYPFPSSTPSEQEVLAEDLGDARGLEIYVLFPVVSHSDFLWLTSDAGDGTADLTLPLIIRASTGEVVYTDPISQSYEPRVQEAVDRALHSTSSFDGYSTTWIVSWSDKDPSRRRWTTQLSVDDSYRPTPWTNRETIYVENTVQTALVEDGRVKFYITPRTTYLQYHPRQIPSAIFYAAAVVPTMSAEKWLWIDEPDVLQTYPPDYGDNAEVLQRTQYLMSAETGVKQSVGEWTPLWGTDERGQSWPNIQYAIAPKVREMVMLPPGFLYAHGESVYAIPELKFGFQNKLWRSVYPLGQDWTAVDEKQKFVKFLTPDGQIDSSFTTFRPLTEDPDLRGKGRVKPDQYPAGFQAVLESIRNKDETDDWTTIPQISWHVVRDPDLVPAGRR